MLYQENKEKGPKQEVDFFNAIYTQYHPKLGDYTKCLKKNST